MAVDQAHGTFGYQIQRAIERAEQQGQPARTPTAMIDAARAADSGKGAPVAFEDPLRIARRAVSAGLAPTVGAVLAPADGTPTVDALAVAYEKVLGEANFLGSDFLFAGAARAEAVCRVVIRTPTGAVAGYGTGFMVSPAAVMTNHHVLESVDTAGQSVIQFGYRERAGGTMHPVAEFALEPARLFVTD